MSIQSVAVLMTGASDGLTMRKGLCRAAGMGQLTRRATEVMSGAEILAQGQRETSHSTATILQTSWRFAVRASAGAVGGDYAARVTELEAHQSRAEPERLMNARWIKILLHGLSFACRPCWCYLRRRAMLLIVAMRDVAKRRSGFNHVMVVLHRSLFNFRLQR